MKYSIICADPPWSFDDRLTMSDVKRGAESQYVVLDNKAIVELDVPSVTADDAVLALWVPSSLLQEGLDTMKSWGFKQTQTHVWVKIKQNPISPLIKFLNKWRKEDSFSMEKLVSLFEGLEYESILAFGMGRLFRQTHEICLVGTKGKMYQHLKNKSQRSVHFGPNTKHSSKPEKLQNMLDKMFPDPELKRLEIFARRTRENWETIGNEVPGEFFGEDIRDSLKRLSVK